MVNPDDILDLNANAKELRKAHARLKVDVERYMGDLKHIMMKVRYLWHEVQLARISYDVWKASVNGFVATACSYMCLSPHNNHWLVYLLILAHL